MTLWRKLEEAYVIGPILFQEIKSEDDKPEVSFEDCQFRVAIGPFCRILELIDLVCTPRLRVLRQRIVEARREAFQ